MKRIIFCLFCAGIVLSAMTLVACSGSSKAASGGTEDSPAAVEILRIATDSVRLSDSLIVSGCKATVSISGQYPSDGPRPLLDSVRTWLASSMFSVIPSAKISEFTSDNELLSSGKALADSCAKRLLAEARNDFKNFGADGGRVDYEYVYSFGPLFESDRVSSFFITCYTYTGGAHGSTVSPDRSFDNNTGEMLTFDNIFRDDARDRLLTMILNGLWRQYFKPSAAPGATLDDMLLVSRREMSLPQNPPVFMSDGIAFTYQQYEIAPYAAGLPRCVIPYAELKPLMTPEGAALIP